MSDDRICVGVVGGAFGVSGEVRLKSFTAEPDAIADYGPFETEDGARSFDMQLVRPIKQGFAVRLSGVRSKEDADALKGVQLFVPRTRLPQLPDDEYYHADLIGLAVLDTGGVALGTVRAVLNHGAADLLEVAQPGTSQTALLPFTQAIVPTVDLAAGKIIADPPDGLFE
ncbi:Ribosome maturation factor RimM [Roseivivax sp. THAF40]|uniref:ribosome maturation factor RimM n=1 Tax=unclassified Roseivivax TaxID=2639302 RepID=UPI00126888DD|nr:MULTISPECIES: ribosome maturation factor RimM [unclassified Roseivivax]QFS81406.1 Ribosome maturation factor RimM [Roseivivax sp. THAF197b]QFT45135.1 Ribosome maturation factor RimM [Roseivivax sp. THAF40]